MRYTNYKTRNTKYAFTFVEILIAVVLLGILAAIVLPILQDHIQQARESAAKDNLRALRGAIEYYAAQHEGFAPGYFNGEIGLATLVTLQLTRYTDEDGNTMDTRTQHFPFGCYLKKIPENPFNNKTSIEVLGVNEPFPESANGDFGWIYKPSTKVIRLDWPGTDSAGIAYFDY